jgi:hypothetical protein
LAQPLHKVVIRTYAPQRRWIVVSVLVVAGLLAAYLLFESGRYSAGFDRIAELRKEGDLQAEIVRRDATIKDLRRIAADFDTFKASQSEERSELARSIGELQAQVARQSQDLAFYQGIVGKTSNAPEVRIERVRIDRGTRPASFIVHLTLVQPVRPEALVTGTITLTLEGQKGADAARLDLAALTDGRLREIPYSFRYFSNLDREIVIPDDFRPERLTVEIRSSRRGVNPVTQTVLWTADAV